jgi:hypothetical protein
MKRFQNKIYLFQLAFLTLLDSSLVLLLIIMCKNFPKKLDHE